MNQLNILIIEDDPIWQLKLQVMLPQLQIVSIRTASSLTQARQLLDEHLPDLVIADMVLPDGIAPDLFATDLQHLPVIFITAHQNEELLKKATQMPNIGFLVKPFELFSLQASIELLMTRLAPSTTHAPQLAPKGLLVTGRHNQRINLSFQEIYFVKAEGNYSIIYTLDRKYVLKRSLRKVAFELPTYFIQIQKAYLVNLNHIDRISQSWVQINQQSIPLGRFFRKKLLDSLGHRASIQV